MRDDFRSGHESAFRLFTYLNFWSLDPRGTRTGKPLSLAARRALVLSYRNLNREVPLAEAAEYAGVTPGHLERTLEEEIGLGFHAWHTGERIRLAMRRMKFYEDTPKLAMLAAGFLDCARFACLFRAWTGMCARDWQDEALKETTPLERAKARARLKKWAQYERVMLFILEGKPTVCRLETAERLGKEVAPRVIIHTDVDIPEGDIWFNPIGWETNGAKASLRGEVKIRQPNAHF